MYNLCTSDNDLGGFGNLFMFSITFLIFYCIYQKHQSNYLNSLVKVFVITDWGSKTNRLNNILVMIKKLWIFK
ncbi:hypothetical protein QTP88_007647 [Uroleucon formosanum]